MQAVSDHPKGVHIQSFPKTLRLSLSTRETPVPKNVPRIEAICGQSAIVPSSIRLKKDKGHKIAPVFKP